MGVMVESHLVEGKQAFGFPEDLIYGQSITDACLGWEDSIRILDDLEAAVRARRSVPVAFGG
jgi:3-deoxy-7-phosphoheptulonate synthase